MCVRIREKGPGVTVRREKRQVRPGKAALGPAKRWEGGGFPYVQESRADSRGGRALRSRSHPQPRSLLVQMQPCVLARGAWMAREYRSTARVLACVFRTLVKNIKILIMMTSVVSGMKRGCAVSGQLGEVGRRRLSPLRWNL